MDGAKLSPGKIERFRHNDIEHLERVLQSLAVEAGKLIVVDGLFSMEGDLASLGGFIAGDETVVHYIKHTARSLIFSASIPPANAAAALAALSIQSSPRRFFLGGSCCAPATWQPIPKRNWISFWKPSPKWAKRWGSSSPN